MKKFGFFNRTNIYCWHLCLYACFRKTFILILFSLLNQSILPKTFYENTSVQTRSVRMRLQRFVTRHWYTGHQWAPVSNKFWNAWQHDSNLYKVIQVLDQQKFHLNQAEHWFLDFMDLSANRNTACPIVQLWCIHTRNSSIPQFSTPSWTRTRILTWFWDCISVCNLRPDQTFSWVCYRD